MLTDTEKKLLQMAEKMELVIQTFIDEAEEAEEPGQKDSVLILEKMLLARFRVLKHELGQDWQSLLAAQVQDELDKGDLFTEPGLEVVL